MDQDGVVLDILVQDRRDSNAAKRFFRRLLNGLQYVPTVIVTDKLRGSGVAQRHLLPGVEHRQSRYLNNRAENSHRLTRRRERQMQRIKNPRSKLRGIGGRKEADQKNAASCGEYVPKEIQISRASPDLSLRPLVHLWPLPSAPTPPCSQACHAIRSNAFKT
jgi:hypothetical protein